MRRIVLLISIVLLSAAWAAAQYGGGANSESTSNASNITVAGCLDEAGGNYILTDQSGAIYRLTGKTEKLKAHVRQTIRVTGVSTSVTHVPGSMSEGTETQPSLSVISFKRISNVCAGNDTNNIP
jgi:hypothetical protein